MSVPLLSNVFRPVVANRRDVRTYVMSVTLLAWLVAIAADFVNHLLLGSVTEFLQEASITTLVVCCIAVPIARSMGNAHLELYHAKREAERLGRTDPLTGVVNRRALYESAAKWRGGALALAIVDIDCFKRINDIYGHAAGDEVIKAVAASLRDDLGDLGVVARIGGEEFALLCVDRPVAEIRRRLQLFRQRVAEQPFCVGEQLLYATVSVGFVTRPRGDFDTLYAAADKALYAAKATGRDRVMDFDEISEIAA